MRVFTKLTSSYVETYFKNNINNTILNCIQFCSIYDLNDAKLANLKCDPKQRTKDWYNKQEKGEQFCSIQCGLWTQTSSCRSGRYQKSFQLPITLLTFRHVTVRQAEKRYQAMQMVSSSLLLRFIFSTFSSFCSISTPCPYLLPRSNAFGSFTNLLHTGHWQALQKIG